MTKRPKLMIVGHARHGKDTVCEMLAKHGYTWASSSWVCGELAVWPDVQYHMSMFEAGELGAIDFGYGSYEECFDDRANHRAFWYDCISEFNREDKTRLGRLIYDKYDIYCGIRNGSELAALREAKVIDFTIWIDRLNVMPEASDSMTIRQFQADHLIYNNGTLEDLQVKVDKFYHGFLKPWEQRLADPEPALPESPKVKYEEPCPTLRDA